jgi:Glycosyltransferases involved in cell wall biogenesis
MSEKKLLSVVFSFLNEEENLDELIRRTAAACEQTGLEHEMIFVNDNSRDRSEEILRRHAAEDPRIKILNMSRRFGVHPCQLAGIRYAKGDAVVYMDTDLQDPPEQIPNMVEQWRKGAEVVHMQRTHRDGENAAKMWLTVQAYKAINLFSEIQFPVNVGDFKLLDRRVVDELLNIREEDPYMRGLVCWVGFRQVILQYRREARFAGETHVPLLGSGPVKEFLRGVTSFSSMPLYLVFLLGLGVSALSFLMILTVLVWKALGLTVPGWTGLMIAVFFIGGTLHMSIGVVGLYIGRIYNSIKGRPLYIVGNTVNVGDE